MKLIYFITALLYIQGSHSVYSTEVSITGHLKRYGDYSMTKSMTVLVKGDDNYLNKSETDYKGDFNLDFSVSQQKVFDFYLVKNAGDTVLLASATAFDSDEPEITFYMPKLLRPADKIVCPVCKHNDSICYLIYSKTNPHQFTAAATKFYCSNSHTKF